MNKALFINGNRNGYGPDQCGRSSTIGELIDALTEMAEEIGSDARVFLRNDNGYTYGSIDMSDMSRGAYNDREVRVLESWEDYSDIDMDDDEEEEEDDDE